LSGVGPLTGPTLGQTPQSQQLADFRQGLNLPPAGSQGDEYTVSKLEMPGGQEYYGVNAHGQPTTLTQINAITPTHAEGDAAQQAINDGAVGQGGTARMFTDRDPCWSCGRSNGIGSLARNLGVDEIQATSPSGTRTYTPSCG
jgi:hypothetical protein